jgi:uncharacterized protein (DUF111 family)
LPIHTCWAFFDCFAGVSGDMTLGALIDLGLPVAELQDLITALGLTDVSLTARRVTREHLTGIKVEIEAAAPQPPRTYREICALIEAEPVEPVEPVGRESAAHPAFSIILSLVSNVIICRPFKVINVAFHVSVKV